MNVEKLQHKIRNFVRERDWEQFHSPKNIAMALNVEVAELMEIFQWMSEEESRHIQCPRTQTHIEDEVADVAVYLLRLCDLLGVDLNAAIENKMQKNAAKYPVEQVRGSSRKYSEYESNAP